MKPKKQQDRSKIEGKGEESVSFQLEVSSKGANETTHLYTGAGGWRTNDFPSRKEETTCAAAAIAK